MQARQLLEHTGWPTIAEFTIDQAGPGRLFNVHQPIERWSGEHAAVVTMKSSEGWHAEPLFFRPTGATEPVARFPLPSPPGVDQWM
eukprot:12136035-Alexandrium_andersonii.AAC.1